jgi:hypothetical protein
MQNPNARMELEFLSDGEETLVKLLLTNHFAFPICIAYVFSDENIESAKESRDYYLDLLLDAIKENVNKNHKL